jgi:hypothetical protein
LSCIFRFSGPINRPSAFVEEPEWETVDPNNDIHAESDEWDSDYDDPLDDGWDSSDYDDPQSDV